MKKLELKHITPYLPYGLKMCYDNFEVFELCGYDSSLDEYIVYINRYEDVENFCNDLLQPILHHLSDLTNEQMIIISKLLGDIYNDNMDDAFICTNTGSMLVKTPWDLRIEMFYRTPEICFAVYNTWKRTEKRVRNTYEVMQKLFEWHFDVFGLIDQGLAIDINKINK